MKIGFIGAHGVGKSTIIREFLAKHPEYSTPKEISRKVVEKGLGINFESNLKTQETWFDAFFDIFKEYENIPNFLTSRTLVDLCAYNLYFLKRPQYGLNQRFVQQCIDEMVYNLDWWNMYAYIPIEFPITEENEFRVGQKDHPEYQKEIDDNIRLLLKKYNIPHLTITGSVEERLNQLNVLVQSGC